MGMVDPDKAFRLVRRRPDGEPAITIKSGHLALVPMLARVSILFRLVLVSGYLSTVIFISNRGTVPEGVGGMIAKKSVR
jgi:hypothetical protein